MPRSAASGESAPVSADAISAAPSGPATALRSASASDASPMSMCSPGRSRR
jgi:hypothetical protein